METRFSQQDDQFMAKRNYAETSDGLVLRPLCKLSVVAVPNLYILINQKPLNRINCGLAA